MVRLLRALWIGVLALTLTMCAENFEHPVPNTYVSFSFSLSDPLYKTLSVPDNSMLITSAMRGSQSLGYGNSGVLVYNSGNSFYAFDATCPHDIPTIVATELSEGIAECPVCGSRYVLAGGGDPTSDSPSQYSLKAYKADYNPNTFEVFVSSQ